MSCRDCVEDRDHCHGTLVRHAGSAWSRECSEGGACSGLDAAHEFRIDCSELDGPCPDAGCREAA